jgi:hypothetical protein
MRKNLVLPGLLLLTLSSVSFLPTSACTIFTASIGETVLFGNNEDYCLPNTFLWFVPAQGNSHGYCYVGFDENHNAADGYRSTFYGQIGHNVPNFQGMKELDTCSRPFWRERMNPLGISL